MSKPGELGQGADKSKALEDQCTKIDAFYAQTLEKLKKDRRDASHSITQLEQGEAPTLYTFICDSSGSMSGADYKKMMDGVGDFLKVMRSNDDCKYDQYSLVLYGAVAEQIERQVPIKNPFTPPAQFTDGRSCGTNFNRAFEVTLNEIKVSQ